MVGLRQLATRSPPTAMKSLANMSMKVFGCISLISAPAAKAFSPPVKRMHPILSSASRSSTAAAISRNTPKDSALSILGRFSVMTPTAPLLSTMMYSNVLMVHPAPDLARGNVPAGAMGIKWGEYHRGRIRCPGRGAAPGIEGRSRHEHARSGCHRQQCTKTDEDFPDQRGSVPGAVVAAGRAAGQYGRCGGRGRLGGGHRQRRRRWVVAFVQRPIDIVELISRHDLSCRGRLRASRIVWWILQDIVGPHRHGLGGVAGRRVGGCQLRIGVSDRWRDLG